MSTQNSKEKPWHKNAQNLLIVNSILAAISAITAQTFITLKDSHKDHPSIILGLGFLFAILALISFIISSEKIPEAVDEDDIRKHVVHFLTYNFGVLSPFLSLTGLVQYYFNNYFKGYLNLIPLLSIFIIWCAVWGKDSRFLLFAGDRELNKYISELEGEYVPKKDPDLFMSIFYRLRSLFKIISGANKAQALPHENVYTRLGPSEIHGVGAFAIKQIPKDTKIFPDDEDNIIRINKDEITNISPVDKKLYDDFCIIKNDEYGCPPSFNRLTVSWYLNDSENPNVRVDENYDMWAIRDIKEGEELTIDSSKFSEQPYK